MMIFDKNIVNISEEEKKLIERGWGKEIAYNIEIKTFFYTSDKNNVKAYIARPIKVTENLPLIIWNRGGNNKSGLLDDFIASGILGEIASWGYIVLASQFREKDEFGGSEVNDILNLLELSGEIKHCDNRRIGMEGWSRGGMMTYLALKKTDKIKCAVVIAGLSDMFRNEKTNFKLNNVFKSFLGKLSESDLIESKKKRSAVYFADEINKSTNVLFIHGTADEKISYFDSVDMFNRMKILNPETSYQLELLENGDHYLKKYRRKVSELRRKWFDRNLKLIN